ncbi:hypothetical protein HDU86_007002 [Geranomyces michiganensis]|nr:hypothetical protein HDU86_007002 [Geranomyces michiganensis]
MPQARPLLPPRTSKTGRHHLSSGKGKLAKPASDENSKPKLPAKPGLPAGQRAAGNNLRRKTLDLISAAERVSQTLQSLDRSEKIDLAATQRKDPRNDDEGRVAKETNNPKAEQAARAVVDEAQQTDDIVLSSPSKRLILSSILHQDDNASSYFRASLRAPDTLPKKAAKPAKGPNQADSITERTVEPALKALAQHGDMATEESRIANEISNDAAHAVVDESQQTEDKCPQPAPPVRQILSSIFQKDDNAGDFFGSFVRAPDPLPKETSDAAAQQNTEPPAGLADDSPIYIAPSASIHKSHDTPPRLEHSHDYLNDTKITEGPPQTQLQPVLRSLPSPTAPSRQPESQIRDDRLVKFLERENNELRQQLLVEKASRPDDTQLRKHVNYLTDENQELRKENQALAFLRRRVQQLEDDNRYLQKQHAGPKPAPACVRCSSFEVEIRTMQAETSRHHIELKAVMDQNAYMRSENSRLTENNDKLRTELVQNAKSQAVSEAQRQIIYERIKDQKQLIESELLNLPLRSPPANTTLIEPSGGDLKGATLLKQMLSALSSIHSTASFLQTPDAISNCCELIHIIGVASRAVLKSEREVEQVDQRIAQLRYETQVTVNEISEHYEQEMDILRSDNRELEKQLEALWSQEKGRSVTGLRTGDVSERVPPTVPDQTRSPDHLLTSEMAQHGAILRYQKQAEDLAAANARLQSNQAHLESLVSKWKDENASLRRNLRSVSSHPAHEHEHAKLVQQVQQLSTQLADQKLTIEKANELIASLRTELEVARAAVAPDLIKELERSWNEKLQGLQLSLSSAGQAHEATQQLSQLTAMVEEHVAQLAAVRAENNDLQQTLVKLRARSKKQEETWSEKYKSVQEDLQALQVEHAQVTSYLQDYERQHQKITMLSTIADKSDIPKSQPAVSAPADLSNHPFCFDAQYLHLYDANVALRHQAAALQQKLSALATLAETRLQENRVLDARHETEHAQIEALQRATEQQMRRIEGLQKDLVIVQEGKQCAEIKLANIVKGYKQLVAPLRST